MVYADVLWDGCTESESDLLGHVQYEAAKIVTGAMKGTSKHRNMQEIEWEDLKTIRAIHKLLLYFKIVNNLCPGYQLVNLCKKKNSSLGKASNYFLLASRTELFKRYFFPSTTTLWNDISFGICCLELLVLLLKLYFPFTMCLVITLLMILLMIYLMPFSTLVHVQTLGCRESPVCFCGYHNETVDNCFLEYPLYWMETPVQRKRPTVKYAGRIFIALFGEKQPFRWLICLFVILILSSLVNSVNALTAGRIFWRVMTRRKMSLSG